MSSQLGRRPSDSVPAAAITVCDSSASSSTPIPTTSPPAPPTSPAVYGMCKPGIVYEYSRLGYHGRRACQSQLLMVLKSPPLPSLFVYRHHESCRAVCNRRCVQAGIMSPHFAATCDRPAPITNHLLSPYSAPTCDCPAPITNHLPSSLSPSFGYPWAIPETTRNQPTLRPEASTPYPEAIVSEF